MMINVERFQLQADDGQYLNSEDYFGQAIGVWGHPGVRGKRILMVLSDGIYLWLMSFKDQAVLDSYLREHLLMQVVGDGHELVSRYKVTVKGDEK